MSSRRAFVVCLLSLVTALRTHAAGCVAPSFDTSGLNVRDGFVEFMRPADLKPLLKMLPTVANSEVDNAIRSPNTMWYDEASMVFLYQDSIETVVGGRANCVGRLVGERNKNDPQIGKLLNYFGADYRFNFPFRTAAGTDRVEGDIKVVNFWVPPRDGDKVIPVKYWQPTSRGRWSWTFPFGTLFGEILFQKGPDDRYYAFEIRTRKRYRDGWAVNVFRPFVTSESFAQAIIAWRPNWQNDANLTQVVNHLRNKNTLVAHKLESKSFGKVFPAVTGALDPIPQIQDASLIKSLLLQTPFVSSEGTIWKENGRLETYAPSSAGTFSIVPKNYEIGMYAVNEVSCNRCHSETGRRLGEFEFDIILYGEVWGEERIFTWHLFEPNPRIFDTWDDNDVSRKVNSRMVKANLLSRGKPADSDPNYKVLPGVFVPDNRIEKGAIYE